MKTLRFMLLAGLAAPAAAAEISISVVTPSRAEQRLSDVPAAVQVILPEELAAMPGSSLDQKLGLVAGLNASRNKGIYSYSNAVSLRGFSSSEQGRALVLLDGFPVNTSATGSANWNRLRLEEIARVEVFKGPASSMYGSNAVGGVINVITRRPGKGAAARAEVSHGSYETLSGRASASVSDGVFSFAAAGGLLDSQGYSTASARGPYTADQFVREKSMMLKAGYQEGDASLDLAWSHYDGLRGEGEKIRAEDGVSRGQVTNFFTLAVKDAAGDGAWRLAVHHQDERYGRFTESLRNSVYGSTDTVADRYDSGVAASFHSPLGAGYLLSGGFDLQLGKVDASDTGEPGYVVSENRASRRQYSPFAQLERRALDERLKLLAGLRYDKAYVFDAAYINGSNPAFSLDPLPEHSWERVSPKFSAGFRYSESAEQYVSYGHGFRPAPLEDLCLSLVRRNNRYLKANPDLKPELTDTLETGFRLSPVKGLSLEPAVYRTRGRDFIYTMATGEPAIGGKTVEQKRNLGGVLIYGAELDARYYAGAGFSLSGAYAYSRASIESYPQDASKEGKILTYSPRHTASASAEWRRGPLTLTAGWQYKDTQFTDDSNTQVVGAYSVLSAGVRRKFSGLEAGLQADNLLDERYLESETDRGPGRVLTVSLAAKF
jgi:iron complex outermembrane receptor protein